jgi:hypothetical protein
MDENNSDALRNAKGILLTFRNQDGASLKQAFTVLVEYEEPEMLEMTHLGDTGLFQWFKFKDVGLLVEKVDGEIIEVREKKF